jgi:hypothetical protein
MSSLPMFPEHTKPKYSTAASALLNRTTQTMAVNSIPQTHEMRRRSDQGPSGCSSYHLISSHHGTIRPDSSLRAYLYHAGLIITQVLQKPIHDDFSSEHRRLFRPRTVT